MPPVKLWLRSRLSYANVTATLALFLALGGTATAALVITGKQVKNESLTTSDIRNGTLLARDFRRGQLKAGPTGPAGPAGAAGAPGAAGAVGPAGPTGTPGRSAGDTLPAGQTMTGYFSFSGTTATADLNTFHIVSLPMRVPTPLTSASAVDFSADAFPSTTDDDDDCTGTFSNPTAPSGQVCLYVSAVSGIAALEGQVLDPSDSTASRSAFGVQYNVTNDNGAYRLFAAWAYTAPA